MKHEEAIVIALMTASLLCFWFLSQPDQRAGRPRLKDVKPVRSLLKDEDLS